LADEQVKWKPEKIEREGEDYIIGSPTVAGFRRVGAVVPSRSEGGLRLRIQAIPAGAPYRGRIAERKVGFLADRW
jgi:hypothetical protein